MIFSTLRSPPHHQPPLFIILNVSPLCLVSTVSLFPSPLSSTSCPPLMFSKAFALSLTILITPSANFLRLSLQLGGKNFSRNLLSVRKRLFVPRIRAILSRSSSSFPSQSCPILMIISPIILKTRTLLSSLKITIK